ncbi:MAG: hypothetical protein J5858_15085 [Lentisphaeria bacterium]|nr:hypothetical protein [Lentisphaeria bacterium]
MKSIIAVDLGTSRIKAARFSSDGVMSGLCSQRLDRAASPGLQDAEDWFKVAAALLRELTAKNGKNIDGVVLTGNMHALLGIDPDGNPVAPARLWSNNSAQAQADDLNRQYGPALLERFGCRAIPVFTLPKIMQMKQEQAELYRRTSVFLQSKDFVTFRLTGRYVTDPTDASGVMGMDLSSCQWDEDLFRELGIDVGKLPQILPSASICGKVTEEAAAATGLRTGTPVVTGSGDLASAALGSGVNDQTISLTLGTAGQLLAAGSPGTGRKLAGKLFVFAHADPERELYLGSVPSGGFSFEWFARTHNISMEEFFCLARSAALDENLPLFYPYLLGKGAPSMDYTPCGSWKNLCADHSLKELCRAAVFGTLCPLRICADLLESCAGKRSDLVLQALACRETAVRETAGALFRQNKFLPLNSEASLLGAAIIGFTALGAYRSIADAAEKMVKNTPAELNMTDPAQQLFQRFLKE